MGLKPSKEEIFQILKESAINPFDEKKRDYRIEYKKKEKEKRVEEKEEENEEEDENNSDDYDDEFNEAGYNTNFLFKNSRLVNVNQFPYKAIGTLIVKFQYLDEDFFYTCFLIS